MRHIKLLLLLLCFGWILPLQAQDNPTPYDIALQRIEEARVSGATILHLEGIGLPELPPEIGQLSNLQTLSLFHNQLTKLPSEIGQLDRLETLSLSNNLLSSLPSEIGNLNTLRVLVVSDNQLTNLPAGIGQLKNLRRLNLDDNQLSYLPSEIGQLSNLCYLNVAYNNLNYLPNSTGNLSELTRPECEGYDAGIYFAGNPLISPPPFDTIVQGTPAVLAYLRNQAWWHLQRMIISVASGVGFLAIIFLGLRWRYHRLRSGKKKREEI